MWCLSPFTETIGNDGIWKEDEGFQTTLIQKELLMETKTSPWWCLEELPTGPICMILNWKKVWHSDFIFKYDSSKAVFQKEVYLSKEDTTYEGQQLLDQLATYGKDRT